MRDSVLFLGIFHQIMGSQPSLLPSSFSSSFWQNPESNTELSVPMIYWEHFLVRGAVVHFKCKHDWGMT